MVAEETGQVAQVAPAKKGAGASAAARANGAAEDSFEALFAASERSIKEDEIVEGRVLQILKDHVLVDVGHKSEGLIPIDEFRTRDGGLTVGEGDTVEVYFEAAVVIAMLGFIATVALCRFLLRRRILE